MHWEKDRTFALGNQNNKKQDKMKTIYSEFKKQVEARPDALAPCL